MSEIVRSGKELVPRKYQLDLLEYVSKRNAIIYLPTGAGKTYVAILALKRYSQQLQNTIEKGGKRVIFMTNTVELARQQFLEIKKNTSFNIGFYVGERDVDNWSRKKWEEEIDENQVLVGTAQIFLDLILQNYIKVTDLSMVVIDECHHATKSHPMHEFMRLFQYVPDQSKLPRVIGLTGVLLKTNKLGNIVQELNNLEAIFRSNIVTVSSMEEFNNVMVFSTKPTEEMVTYLPDTHQFALTDKIKSEIALCCSLVDSWDLGNIPLKLTKGLAQLREPNKKNFIKNLLKDFVYQMDDFGLYAAAIAIMSPIIEFEIKKRQAETLALRNLYRSIITKCEQIRHVILKKLKDMVDEDNPDDSDCDTVDVIMNFSTSKLRSLLMYMKAKFQGKKREDICCLVFVERRYSAKCLYYVVQKFVEGTPELSGVVFPQFMVGRNSISPGIESILDRKWNKSAIEKFRTKECNVIICSKVLEEGIDVQACNYVFAFDQLKTFSSYIQTKGRARSTGSTYGIFAPKLEETKVIQQIQKYKQIHEIMKNYLIGRILDREDPTEEDIAEHFADTIPPFVIPSGARLLFTSALQLLHRYTQLLPTDSFGIVMPWFSKLPSDLGQKRFRVSLKLPMQSCVKETIISEPMETTKLAKMSAAFTACKKLYEQGELNEKLLPITKRECVAKVSAEFFQHWKKYDDDVMLKNPGKQHRRLYERKCPDELYNALPVIGQTCYAYEIKFIPHFEEDSYTAPVIEQLKTPTNYALLLSKRLPALAEMPLFMNQGKLSVKISEEPLLFNVSSSEELEQLQKYHMMIFRDILQCWKNFFVLDRRNKEHSYLIVPINGDRHIDWALVRNFQRLSPQRNYTLAERQRKVYRPEDYLGKVVNKWYSGIDSERYVVTKVRTDLTPQSPFDTETYKSFANFIESKYSDQIERVVQKQQFLLEVNQVTSRRNFFINAKGKNTQLYKKRGTVILIPELCHNFMYPGDMWRKATFLPSILHRLHFLLHADAMLRRINAYLGIGINGYKPKPLMIDTSLHRVVDSDGNAMEELEEPKKMFTLPPKQTEKHFEVRTLMSDESVQWKEYLEPADHTYKCNSLYPVELDYYYKFISGLAFELDNLKLEEEEEWTKSQLTMPTPKPKVSPLKLNHMTTTPLCLSDVPLAEKRCIDILERSLSANSIKSAEQFEFMAALTTAGANDVFDMERFEVLGDSFLKFSISLYLVNKFPKWHEGFLTEIKSRMVSNRNLLYCMNESDIPKRICASLFSPNCEWLPPMASLPQNVLELLDQNFPMLASISPGDLYAMELNDEEVLSGVCSSNQLERFVHRCSEAQEMTAGGVELNVDNDMNLFIYKDVMADKVVADTLEALLGVCVKNYGIHHAFRMLEFFGICKPDVDKPLWNLLDLSLGSPLLRTNISSAEVDGFLINHSKLEENLGYKFRDRAYLLQAVTHPSFPTNRLTGCYQELEFIGDAILDFLISCYIFERYVNMNPGMLTDLRSALVNNITLSCVCVRHRFHLFLLAENSMLAESIKTFADFQETQEHRVTDQVRILMEETMSRDDSDEAPAFNMSVNVDVPKALGDVVEALIAAVYLDSRDLRTTWNVIYHLLEQELNEFSNNVPIEPVRQLYEHKHADPKFGDAIVENEAVMVKCLFTCLDQRMEVSGFASNATQAKKAAAKHALQILARHST